MVKRVAFISIIIVLLILVGVFALQFFEPKEVRLSAPFVARYCLAVPFPRVGPPNPDQFPSREDCLNFLSNYIDQCNDCCHSRSNVAECEAECNSYLNGPGSDYCYAGYPSEHQNDPLPPISKVIECLIGFGPCNQVYLG
jgi:hypothetical protein